MKKDRTLLEQNLIKPTLEIKRKRSIVKDIKAYLSEKHAIFEGSVQTWINNPVEELKDIDPRLLFLFAEQIYLKSGDSNITPEHYFTEAEIKTSRQYSGRMLIEEDLQLPLDFKPVISHGRDAWVTKIDIRTLVKMLKSRLLHWNPESQREATYKKINGEIIEEATLIMANVIEMKNLLKSGKLVSTQLTLNASVGTSNNGEEINYNEDSFDLRINEGTKIDIVDGYHRIKAAELAFSEKPDIEFAFDLKILNLTVDRAAQYLAQISKGERISETKRKTMAKETNADLVIAKLRSESELKDRISKKEGLTTSLKELVTYNTLRKAIDDNFDLERTRDMYDVSDYLIEYFNVLLSYYEEEFTEKYHEYKEASLINDNNLFLGYIILASKMKENDIDAKKVRNYIKNIDFSRDNPLWKELDVLDDKGRLTRNAKSGIEKYFSKIEL